MCGFYDYSCNFTIEGLNIEQINFPSGYTGHTWVDQRALTVGGMITVRLTSSLTRLYLNKQKIF